MTQAHSKPIDLEGLVSATWSKLPHMMSQREGGAAVAIPGNRVLVIGGYHVQEKFLKSCAVLDLNNNSWQSFPPMKTARMGCAAVFLEQHNAVVVVGGFQRGRKYLATAEYLDLSSQRWHRLAPMQIPRAGCAAVTVLGKRVVVLGGWKDGDTALREVEVLDFSAQQWHLLPDMSSPRAGCAAAALGHLVMVVGGHTTSGKGRGCRSSVECLDLSTQSWARYPSMKEKRDASACVVYGDCYVLVMGGGESSTSPLSTGEVFDVNNKTWHPLPAMRQRRFGCAAALVGNKVIVIGGRGDGHHLDSVEGLTLPLETSSSSDLSNTNNSGTSLSGYLGRHSRSSSSEQIRLGDGDTKSYAETILSQDDKTRVLQNYESRRAQAKEIYDRTVSALNERLRIIEKERQKIKEHLAKAEKDRDDQIRRAEQERSAALQKFEQKASGSSAPERLLGATGDGDAAEDDSDDEPPQELCCSITGELMEEPVTAMDGHTYERSAIEAWFARFDNNTAPTSPMTNERLPSRRLIPSHNIRSQCQTFRQKHPSFGGGMEETNIDPLAHLSHHKSEHATSNGSNNHSPPLTNATSHTRSTTQPSSSSPSRRGSGSRRSEGSSRPGVRSSLLGNRRRSSSTSGRLSNGNGTTPTRRSLSRSNSISNTAEAAAAAAGASTSHRHRRRTASSELDTSTTSTSSRTFRRPHIGRRTSK
eukprot:CAMPEP_0194029312 /NCGR_PEP_ID=MMETSP0009_2-20130614/3067_1 /TAXON_ID=210454 /ORGANISM="Grammatophora oceanica, Strain CCMP 410" /LENGTH=700 /DNA_ID=CAMNT_0038668937 /DNA_START=583 /DNA_END=2685 /DNA_ORIENTATION=+